MEDDANLMEVVDRLCSTNNGLTMKRPEMAARHPLPSRDTLMQTVESLRTVLFPGYYGRSEIGKGSVRFHLGAILDHVRRDLVEQVHRGLCFTCLETEPAACHECSVRSGKLVDSLLARLPEIRRLLATDVQAAYEGDPAATSPDETILCYPGLLAMTNYRLAHEMYKLNIPLLPRMLTEQAHSTSGIDIHPGAQIGEYFFMDHGTGIVIGETCVIGNRVRVYQGVTLGAKSFPLDDNGNPIKGISRHPIVEDEVIIYGGATILGRVTIGRGSVIGGNVWLTRSVPAGSKISQQAYRQEIFSSGGGI